MIFGNVDTRNSRGCYLAHSLRTVSGRLGKGGFLTEPLIEQLSSSGHETILVASLQADDVHENEAAAQLASAIAGSGVALSRARTGRVNLFAQTAGLFHFDAQVVREINSIDQGITAATVAENQWVANAPRDPTMRC